ncbi:uncharacterized protein involved in type VI secretion and phage assembly [Bradyrhizobium japonicum]
MDTLFTGAVNEAEREVDGFLQGLAVGIVTDNKDPEGLARVRVRLPWQTSGHSSYWARIAMLMAGDGRGTYFLPEIGDEVLIGAENGDPSHLYVIGVVWNGKQKPPENNDDGKNDRRVIYSRSGHRLLFDDGAQPRVELLLADKKRLVLDQNGVTLDDDKGNKLVIESSSGAITIASTASLKLKSQTISIEAGASMEIKASGTLSIKGAMVQLN